MCHKHSSTGAKDRFSVKLLEINAEPAIEMTGKRLQWILEDLFEAISRTCVVPFFSAKRAEIQSLSLVFPFNIFASG